MNKSLKEEGHEKRKKPGVSQKRGATHLNVRNTMKGGM